LWCGIIGGAEAVSPGIQHFDRYRSLLEGKKVGIVANQTAVLETGDGYKHSVDFLRDHQVQLIRIFCPEHGFRGDADAGETVGDYRDRQTFCIEKAVDGCRGRGQSIRRVENTFLRRRGTGRDHIPLYRERRRAASEQAKQNGVHKKVADLP